MMKRCKHILLWLLVMLFTSDGFSQKAYWIWYPGDYEIWLSNKMQNRRTERGTFFPPFWRMDNHYILVDFHKEFELKEPETIRIYTEGKYNVKLNSEMVAGMPSNLKIPAGKVKINIKIYSRDKVPALMVTGRTIGTDTSWKVTYEDKEWIDETGKVSDQSGTTWLNAGAWDFTVPEEKPSDFRLATKPMFTTSKEETSSGLLADFGKETFGFLRLHGIKGAGKWNIYYGESREEALSPEFCETLDVLEVGRDAASDTVLPLSKAFRFVHLVPEGAVSMDSVSMLYEYLPLEFKGAFRCSDPRINKIWEVAAYTLHLSSREFFIDGIKRDRWIWSGDAYQSYLMNYYLFFDAAAVKRTTLALRGKEPVTSHINTILDYTFYWFLGIWDYYLFTGDAAFLKQVYPRMETLMDFCLERRNGNGYMEGLAGDWVFIDWAEGLSKKGEVSFEQLLLGRSLEIMAKVSRLLKADQGEYDYGDLTARYRKRFLSDYWDEQKNAIVHSRINGIPSEKITRYANMFSILFGYFSKDQQEKVKHSVLLSDTVQEITTPYMRFYELEALCALGEQKRVLKEMRDYWGGMLDLGATSFWEEYNPAKSGPEHYAMYGRPFGKSLCHAWGASPIYLLGKYYLGVKPESPGYATFTVSPDPGDLEWVEGKVPLPDGEVELYCGTSEIKVTHTGSGKGTLVFRSAKKPVCKGGELKKSEGDRYEVTLSRNQLCTVQYRKP